MEIKNVTCFEVSDNIVHRKLNDSGFMLIELQGDNMFELHDVGGLIWEEIIKGSSFGEIIATLGDAYEPFGETEIEDTRKLIKDLIERKIISIR